MTSRVAMLLAVFLAMVSANSAQGDKDGWKTGRISTVRVLERAEDGGSVTPPVEDNGTHIRGRGYGAIAYVVLKSGKDTYQTQYAGGDPGALEPLRGRTVQFRIAGSKLYLKRTTGEPLELQILPARRPPAEVPHN